MARWAWSFVLVVLKPRSRTSYRASRADRRTGRCGLILGIISAVSGLGNVSKSIAESGAQSQYFRQLVDALPGVGPQSVLQVPSVLLLEPASESSLGVIVLEQIAGDATLRLQGLPAAAVLSEGHFSSAGYWDVPISAARQLRVLFPAETSGKREIKVTLVGGNGDLIAEARTVLIFGPMARLITPDPVSSSVSGSESIEATDAPPPPMWTRAGAASSLTDLMSEGRRKVGDDVGSISPPALNADIPPNKHAGSHRAPERERSEPEQGGFPQHSAPSPLAKQALSPGSQTSGTLARAGLLLARGEALLEVGDIASARQFFERAAEAGLASGAMALGATYDPMELPKLGVQGLKPDRAMAWYWYQKASEMRRTP